MEENYASIPAADSDSGSVEQTKRNIWGWYLYSFSSEPFIVSAVSTYIPLLLDSFARISGVLVNDHSKACTSSSQEKCVLPIFNRKLFIDSSSFALYTFSISVLFQTLVVITTSGVVDMWNSVKFKRQILLVFGITGAFSTMLIARLRTDQYYMLAVLAIVSNSCYGVVNVVGNSLLPRLVTDTCAWNPGHKNENPDQLTTLISGYGSGLGYAAAVLVQLCCALLVMSSRSKDNLQVALLFVGFWWLVFQLPMAWLLKDVTAASDSLSEAFKWKRSLFYMQNGWSSLYNSLKYARLLKDVVIFLVGWFIVSDSVSTINSTAILFSKNELNMGTVSLIGISIITMVTAIFGSFLIPQFLAKKLKVSPKYILIYIICWSSVIPLYGILGFILKNIGLKHQWEMFLLAVWYGISLGGLAAVSRSVFTLIIPSGRESTFFSLFSVTDKGSSILGPFLIGLLTDKTHNIRYAFYLLFALLVLSLPVFELLDIERGKKEAEELAALREELDG